MSGTNLWPVRPLPCGEELLSSWLVRFARANGQKLHTFSRLTCGTDAIWNRDIDKAVHARTLHALAARAGLPIHAVTAMTLAAYAGSVYEEHNPYGNTNWILPVGVYHRARRNFGLLFCPRCLGHDRIPYYRRRWRLACSVACVEHGILLHDRCPACETPIAFHRHDFADRARVATAPLTACHACGHDVRTARTVAASGETLSAQRLVNQALEMNWITIQGLPQCRAVLFFPVVHQLMKLVALDRRGRALATTLGSAPIVPEGSRIGSIEQLDLAQRQAALCLALRLLDDWPATFVSACRNSQMSGAFLLRDMAVVPYWFASIVADHLDRSSYTPTPAELAAAAAYLVAHGQAITVTTLNRLLGYTTAKSIAAFIRHTTQNGAEQAVNDPRLT